MFLAFLALNNIIFILIYFMDEALHGGALKRGDN